MYLLQPPVADLIEEDAVVGMAYEDEGQLLVEFYPDAEGEPRLYDVADLQHHVTLDPAQNISVATDKDAFSYVLESVFKSLRPRGRELPMLPVAGQDFK